jgi:hypothetical protein
MKSQTILNIASNIPRTNMKFSKNWKNEEYSLPKLEELLADKKIEFNTISFTTISNKDEKTFISIKSVKTINIKDTIMKMNFNQLLLIGIIIAGVSAFFTKIIIKFYS